MTLEEYKKKRTLLDEASHTVLKRHAPNSRVNINFNNVKGSTNSIDKDTITKKEAEGVINSLSTAEIAKVPTNLKKAITELKNKIEQALTQGNYNGLVDYISEAKKYIEYAEQDDNYSLNDKDSNASYQNALDNANTPEEKEKVYDAFYSYLSNKYNVPVKKFKDLGYAFRIELSHLGFSENTNPFITFVSLYLPNHDLTNEQYNMLNDAYVDRSITERNLTGKGIMGRDDTIFNPSLYEKSIREFDYIVEIQSRLSDKYTCRENVTRKEIIDHYNNFNSNADIKDFLIALLYEGADVTQFNFEGSNSTNQVRSANDIQNILNYYDPENKKGNLDRSKVAWQSYIDRLGIDKSNVGQVAIVLLTAYCASQKEWEYITSQYSLPTNADLKSYPLWKSRLSRLDIDSHNYKDVIKYLEDKFK